MSDQFNLAFVDVGGWDTHVNQGGAQGYLATHVGELGRGLSGFTDNIGPEAWRHTTVLVIANRTRRAGHYWRRSNRRPQSLP